MNDLRHLQAAFNAGSREQWDGFAGHRQRVSSLLGVGVPAGSARLCVLGAGNGNDLDLAGLVRAHREVHLVDLDAMALSSGVKRQGLTDHPGICPFGGVDVMGMLDTFAGWSPLTSISASDLHALATWPAERVGRSLPGRYDRVASTCLLSQIVGNAAVTLGTRHARFAEVVPAIRLGHLRLLSRLAAPGGEVVLITDVVSSEHFPGLALVPEAELPDLLVRLTHDSGLIHGVRPGDILAAIRRDPVLAAEAASVESVAPWLWRLHARDYLVWAVRWVRTPVGH